MDFGDIAAGELHEGCVPLISRIRGDQNPYPGCFGLGEGIREVRDFIAGRLASEGMRKMTIRYEHCQLAEVRLDPDSSISVIRPPDLDAGGMRVIGDNFAMREGKKALNERGSSVGGHIHAVFWDGLERCVGG